MKNNIVRTISKNGGVIVIAIDSTDICREMEQIHKTSATASAALGRLLTAAALMGCMLKGEEESVTLKLKGGGAIGSVIAISDFKGNVRGTCDFPQADLPLNKKNGKLNVGGLVGTKGNLSVIKDLGLKEPYIGEIPLVSGEIAEDVTSYFALSEQIPTVCALGVLVNPNLTIKAAGGYILQLLPGATEEEITLIEDNIAKLKNVSALIDEGKTPEEIAFLVLNGFEPNVLDKTRAEYRCNCSRHKMTKALISIGKDELVKLSKEQKETEIVCGYCNSKYDFTDKDLIDLSKRV